MTEPSPTLRRRALSNTLRTLREQAGMTLVEAEKRLEWSAGKLSRIENGKFKRLDRRDVPQLLDVYGVTDPEERDRIITLDKEARKQGWWDPYSKDLNKAYTTYIGLESAASTIRVFESTVIPGLLQTEEYARAIIEAGPAELTREQIDQRVQIRAKRQELLTREENPLRMRVVLDEAALRREVGGPGIMREQLEHLRAMVADHARVTIQVVTFAAGAHPGASGPFSILSFGADETDSVYTPAPAGQLFVEAPEEVERFKLAFEGLQAMALSPVDSLELIASITR